MLWLGGGRRHESGTKPQLARPAASANELSRDSGGAGVFVKRKPQALFVLALPLFLIAIIVTTY
jgi:hypothetical protein